jgi:diguanylate cyclase (GGDEF)-like protein
MTRAGFSAPEAERRRQQMARFGAVLFGAAAVVTLAGLLLPHQPQVDETGLAIVTALAAATSLALVLGGERMPHSLYNLVVALGTVVVSLALLFNGERFGGAAGGDEMYYLWVVIFAAYFLGRLETAAQVSFTALAYGATLAAIDPGDVAISRWLSTIGLVIGSAVVVRLLSERIEKLLHRLDLAAHTDSLTGLANRLAFEDAFARESARAVRHGGGYALLLADLDRLKEINDRFGHEAGDDAIKQVADVLRDHLRREDFAARIGGDEFAVLLPETDLVGAEQLGERLSHALCELGPAERSFGLSYGVTVPAQDARLDDAMRAADVALYAAKRDRLKVADRRLRGTSRPVLST